MPTAALPGAGPDAAEWPPTLFSVFLDSSKIMAGSEVAFSLDIAVSTAGYEIDGALFLKQHIPGEYLFRDTLTIKTTPTADGWTVRCQRTDERWSEGAGTLAEWDGTHYWIALSSLKGFKARLRLELSK